MISLTRIESKLLRPAATALAAMKIRLSQLPYFEIRDRTRNGSHSMATLRPIACLGPLARSGKTKISREQHSVPTRQTGRMGLRCGPVAARPGHLGKRKPPPISVLRLSCACIRTVPTALVSPDQSDSATVSRFRCPGKRPSSSGISNDSICTDQSGPCPIY